MARAKKESDAIEIEPSDQGQLAAFAVMLGMTVLAGIVTVPVWVQILTMTSAIIFVGSHKSVRNSSAGGEGMEAMSQKDVMMFPLIGSAVLLGLYLVFKNVPAEYVNLLVKSYFTFIGVLVLAVVLGGFAKLVLPRGLADALEVEVARVRVPLTDGETDDGKTIFTRLNVAMLFAGGAICGWWLATDNWAASNAIGIAFSIQGIESLSLGSYFNGAVLLCGLFVYDVFWVFGTDVMVTVAKSFDAPIKLLFPRGADERPSLLGLGDIVIPGIFIALLLRFDVFLAKEKALARAKADSNSKPVAVFYYYFWWTMTGYVAGLAACLACMYYFDAAQPALLYLVPTCLGSSLTAALLRGEIAAMTKWSEEEDEEEEKKKEKKDDGESESNGDGDDATTVETLDPVRTHVRKRSRKD